MEKIERIGNSFEKFSIFFKLCHSSNSARTDKPLRNILIAVVSFEALLPSVSVNSLCALREGLVENAGIALACTVFYLP